MTNTKSWAVIDADGEEFISAKAILFSAAGDIGRAKRLAQKEALYINEDEGPGTVTIERRPVAAGDSGDTLTSQLQGWSRTAIERKGFP